MDHKIDLKTILNLHLKWRMGKKEGIRADLRDADLGGADLGGADLRGANLGDANLRGANLRGANLRGANLRGAYLRDANLRDADLGGADLGGADLRGANLGDANLRGANLRGANLGGANLRGAYLRDANLRDADLGGADLRGANLGDANLRGAKGADLALAMSTHLPDGPIWGWKKCLNGVIVKLLIPADAKRSHGAERKCRAEFADVIEVIGAEVGESWYSDAPKITYRVGERVTPSGWDNNRWNTCGEGIHFFITRLEAENCSL